MTQWLAYFRRLDLMVLLALLVIVAGIWVFIELADEVLEGELQHLDDWAIRSLRSADDPRQPIGPRELSEAARDVTALGSTSVLLLLLAAVLGYLLINRKYHEMWLVLIAAGGGAIISTLLKDLFDRPRPELVPHLARVVTASFPSGHAMLSAVVYLTLGTLLAQLVDRRTLKIYFLGVALFLTLLVGLSRVYLGVHYPTDVLAGWSLGLAWAVLCWLVAQYLRQRGAIKNIDG